VCRGAAYAGKLESAPDAAEATRRLTTLRGIGPWTAAEVVRVAYGDPDAVSVGDYHIPNTVAWALAGEPRGDDARMLELLEPFRQARGPVRCSAVLGHGGCVLARHLKEMRPRGVHAVVARQAAAGVQCLDHLEAGGGAVHHRRRDSAVQLDDRVGRDPLQDAV